MQALKRLIVRPPVIYRIFFPEAIWRVPVQGRKVAYLTFDDGPVPEATPAVLNILEKYGIKATFFMVGDNARRYPHLFEAVKAAGHSIGNWDGDTLVVDTIGFEPGVQLLALVPLLSTSLSQTFSPTSRALSLMAPAGLSMPTAML